MVHQTLDDVSESRVRVCRIDRNDIFGDIVDCKVLQCRDGDFGRIHGGGYARKKVNQESESKQKILPKKGDLVSGSEYQEG